MQFSSLFNYCPVCGSADYKQQNEKSMHCNRCKFSYYINASAAVAAIIVNDKNELLVCKRGKEPAKGTWDLPGGFVDGNESAEQALHREIMEELGAKISTAEYSFSLPNEYVYSGMTIPTLDLIFRCTLADYSNLKAADDVEELFFVPIAELNPENFGLKSIRKAITIFTDGNR